YYNARYYDPEIGHFISPDTLVPDPLRVDAYNRYMYALGNPLKFNDPTGHCEETPDQDDVGCWYLLQRLLHGTRTQGIYEYEEAMAWNAGQIKVLIDYWAANDFNDMNPDAVLIGGGGSIRVDPPLGFDFSARAAVEYIHNYESGENDLFLSGGVSLDFDIQNLVEVALDPLRVISGNPPLIAVAQGTVYLGDIYDLPTNADYKGRSVAEETAAGYNLYSVTDGNFHPPSGSNGPSGHYVGWSPSVGPNFGKSKVTTGSVRLRDTWNSIVDFVQGK
ncbi:MAG: hypothetical protein KDD92_06555, partial [Caldilineaceae bacterium]|nr:hypothetical protein [Caldilineaceae bacterium]